MSLTGNISCWLPCAWGCCSTLACVCCWPCHWGHTASAAREGNCAPDWEPSKTEHRGMRMLTSLTPISPTKPTITVGVEAGTSVHLWVVCVAGGGWSSTCRHLAKSVGGATSKSTHGGKWWRHGLSWLRSYLLVRTERVTLIYWLGMVTYIQKV